MTNIIDDDKLNSIFNLDDVDDIDIDDIDLSEYTDDDQEEIVVSNNSDELVDTDDVTEKSDTDFVSGELKGLLSTTHKLMDAASFILNGAPDADTISSASTLVGSIKDILAELNKTVLIKTRFEEQAKLEQLKINGRLNLEDKKLKSKTPPELGSNNTFIQNNTSTNNTINTGSQEDIVDMIRDIQKNAAQDIKKLK